MMRRSVCVRVSMRRLQPMEHCVQMLGVRSISQGRKAKRATRLVERTHRADVDNVAAGLGVDRLAVLDVDDRGAAAFKEAKLRA